MNDNDVVVNEKKNRVIVVMGQKWKRKNWVTFARVAEKKTTTNNQQPATLGDKGIIVVVHYNPCNVYTIELLQESS